MESVPGCGGCVKTAEFIVLYWKCKEPTETKRFEREHSGRTWTSYSQRVEELQELRKQQTSRSMESSEKASF